MDWTHSWSPKFSDHKDRYNYLHSKLKRGHGLGWGAAYQPWVQVRNVTDSDGRQTHTAGIKVARVHHVLSRHERSFLYMAERWPWVVDIREQWPILDMDRSNELHYERGIAVIVRHGAPVPPTIDFLLTIRTDDGPICRAVAVKTSDDLKKRNVNKYLDVQRVWCEENLIDFSVSSDTGDPTLCETLTELRKWSVDGYEANREKASDFAKVFMDRYRGNTTLSDLLRPVVKILKVDETEAMSLYRYCAWSNLIRLDLKKPVVRNGLVYLDSHP